MISPSTDQSTKYRRCVEAITASILKSSHSRGPIEDADTLDSVRGGKEEATGYSPGAGRLVGNTASGAIAQANIAVSDRVMSRITAISGGATCEHQAADHRVVFAPAAVSANIPEALIEKHSCNETYRQIVENGTWPISNNHCENDLTSARGASWRSREEVDTNNRIRWAGNQVVSREDDIMACTTSSNAAGGVRVAF